VVTDQARRTSHEVDVVAFGEQDRVLAIGEVKWGEAMDSHHLARHARIADLLEARGQRPERLLLFSAAGFTPELRANTGSRAHLVDLHRLYEGD
jgi:hypothetical protein